jgi:LPXTG-motif cell wall-anchored protein
MIVDFVNTGDIQVITLSVLALVSMVGISYLIIRKVKSAKIA